MTDRARVQRYDDAGQPARVTRTPQGGLRVDAAVTRTGVLSYSDGERSWVEYKPDSEVFDAASLASLEGVPVTVDHPPALVDASTWRELTVGHALSAPRRDGDLVVLTLAVQAADVVAQIEGRDLHDVSSGYTCEVDWTPGVTPDGTRYDAVQKAIRYNHIALGPEGWGRAGDRVSLRMNGAAQQVRGERAPRSTMKKIKVKGREFKLDADDDVKVAQDAITEAEAAQQSELGAVKAALMEALTKVASLEAKIAAEEAAEGASGKLVTEDMVPEEVADSIARKRVDLVERARRVLPTEKLDGLKADEIRKRVIAKTLPTVKLDGLTAETIAGMFVAATEGVAEQHRADSLRSVHPNATAAGVEHNDADDHLSPSALLNRRTHTNFEQRRTAAAKG